MTDKIEIKDVRKTSIQPRAYGRIILTTKRGEGLASVEVYPRYKGEDVTDITDLIYRTLVKGLISKKSQD